MAETLAGLSLATVDEVSSDYLKVLLHGETGTGKTTTASTVARAGKTLLVDLTGEHGARSFQGSSYAHNVTVVRPGSVTEIDDLYWALAKDNHGYQAVILDSLTSLQKMSMRYMLGHSETAVREIKKGSAPAGFQTWGQTLDVMTDTATFWYGLADQNRKNPMHVIMTCQTRLDEDDDGNEVYFPDVQRGARSITLATPDYVCFTDMETNDSADMFDDSTPSDRHVVRFGNDRKWKLKARVPVDLRGHMPSVMGRKKPLDLITLGQSLRVGGCTVADDVAKKEKTSQK